METTATLSGTGFDQMANDFEGLEVINPHKAIATLHSFEARGLGLPPFACVNFTTGEDNCAYCGKALKNLFHVKSADARTFIVGSDCVAKTNAVLGGFDAYKKRFDKQMREHRAARARWLKLEKRIKAIEAFKLEHPDVWSWAEKKAGGFAHAMHAALLSYGSLTPGQLDASYRVMEGDRTKVERAIARIEAAPVIANVSAIEASFAKGIKAGIRTPKLRLDTFVLKPAKSYSNNAGAIYVTTREGGTYLGKVMNGKFLRVRDCSAEQEQAIVTVCSDPKAAAIAYGKRYGECCVCGRDLTDGESINRGIGPICAEKYGF